MAEQGYEVRLTWPEVSIGAVIGLFRHIEALKRQRPDAYGRSEADGWSDHIEGACGELAFAKAAHRYWTPTVNTFKTGGDVGIVQVRTRSRQDYQLLVRDDDADDAPFVLVRGRAPCYWVVGWIPGNEAKRTEWRKAYGGRPPAYFVPDEALFSMEDVPR
jgi:hypothetical protein